MKVNATIKQTVAAFAAVAGLAVVGLPSPASALFFDGGHVAFVIYGGDNERYENLGDGSTERLEGTSEIVRTVSSADLSLLEAGAILGPRYALYGISSDRLSFYTTSRIPVSRMTDFILDATFPAQAADVYGFWGFGRIPASTGGQNIDPPTAIVAAADANSLTNILGRTGLVNGNLGFTTHGSLDQMLYVIKLNADAEYPVPQEVGTAILTSDGVLRITPYNVQPIPVPAAAILFGSGLIGLVGFARRSFGKATL